MIGGVPVRPGERATVASLRGHVVALCLAALAAPPALAQAAAPDPFASARATEARVGGIVARLTSANVSLCDARVGAVGVVLHALDQYAPGQRTGVAAATGLDRSPAVFALVPGGPAERAGVRVDEAVVSADGAMLPLASTGRATFATIAAARDALDRAAADGSATLVVRSAEGVERSVVLATPPACWVRPIVTDDDRGRASTDGLNLKVSRGLLAEVPDDGELAAVLAHEFAHVVLAHPAAIRAAGGRGGLFSAFNGRGRTVRRTEEEADRLSVTLLVTAGFDPRAAVAFWRGWGRSHDGLFGDASHGGWDERVATLEAAIAVLPPPPAAPISRPKETDDGE